MRKTGIVLATILLMGAGCITVSAPPSSSSSPSSSNNANLPVPAITSFQAVPATIAPGSTTSLQWQVSNASSVTIDQGIGPVALSGNRIVSPGSSTVYRITAGNQYGTSTATTQVIVAGPAPTGGPVFNLPYVAVFDAVPGNTISDHPVQLTWDVQNAFDVVIDPSLLVIPVKGSSRVTPHFTTTYKLTATNDQGSILATTTVTISGVLPSQETPVVNFFKATPYVIHSGDSSVLSWETQNGSAVNIDNGLGTVDGTGTARVSPQQTTTYMLIVTNPAGAQYQTATVNVK